ncbi:hypothetical protein VTL71DRAFT_9557 [Oculimacula yallundae]|uniref:Myb-like domain-containing protein n=1 Tax=Oculimacula yallundae TaxID=86028 RepID=A0ABR4BR53_9HELO
MADPTWQAEELRTLQWFIKKGDDYRAARGQKGAQLTTPQRKWSWADIAKKMQKVADRDDWDSKRTYDASNCELAWQTLQARTANVKAEVKSEDKDDFEMIDQPYTKAEHGNGDTVDPLPLEPSILMEAGPESEVTRSPDVAAPTTTLTFGDFQIIMKRSLVDVFDFHFNPSTCQVSMTPKESPTDPAYFESKAFIKAESASKEALSNFNLHSVPPYASRKHTSVSSTFQSLNFHSSTPDTEARLRKSASTPESEPTVRTNARWEAHEDEALAWLVSKRKAEQKTTGIQEKAYTWTWEVIAAKMNQTAARDGWDNVRKYTAGNCYGHWATQSTRLPTSRPSVSRRQEKLAKRHAAKGPRLIPNLKLKVEKPLSEIDNNPPPPGPDAERDLAPYHWLVAEREALHEVYVFSRISENKMLSRGECRRRGNWTWTMIAREMNRRAVGAAWHTGRIYDQSNCYNMIKYEMDNFNLKGNVQPLEDDVDEDEGADEGADEA